MSSPTNAQMFSDFIPGGFDMQNAGGLDDCNHAGSYTLHTLDVANQRVKHEANANFTCVVQQQTAEQQHHHNNKRKADEMHHHHHLLVGPVIDNGTGTNGVQQVGDTQPPQAQQRKSMPPNGKKTKGRVKIKMEFIDNKLRRYTTFSKRKTGIMKKAYELSTLTGTQVMLLVASETGHVYTFATRKLQPMITSEAGKALIQTCLNSPDPPMGPGGSSGLDQRMSATGFEEVDLTYTVAEDTENKVRLLSAFIQDSKNVQEGGVVQSGPYFCLQQSGTSGAGSSGEESGGSCSGPDSPDIAPQPRSPIENKTFTTILTPGGNLPSPSQGGASGQTQQTIYRLPSGPLVSIPTVSSSGHASGAGVQSSNSAVTVLPGSPQNLSVVSVLPSGGGSGGVQVYQTAQGVVYATAPSTSNLPEGVILNLQTQEHRGGQQYITIPVPVTLTNQQQISQLVQSQVTSMLMPSSGRKEKSRNK